MDYAIWRACERFHILPPGITKDFDNMASWYQALLISYNQVREYEEIQQLKLRM